MSAEQNKMSIQRWVEEARNNYDALGMMHQLGVIPVMG